MDDWLGEEATSNNTPTFKLNTQVREPNTRFFIIKSVNYRNVSKSIEHGIWATLQRNELILDQAFWNSTNVYLIFAIADGMKFDGYARMMSAVGSSPDGQVFCDQNSSFRNYNWNAFYIEWIVNGTNVAFNEVTHIRNSFNNNQSIRQCRDCQEVNPSAAIQLIDVLDKRYLDVARSHPKTLISKAKIEEYKNKPGIHNQVDFTSTKNLTSQKPQFEAPQVEPQSTSNIGSSNPWSSSAPSKSKEPMEDLNNNDSSKTMINYPKCPIAKEFNFMRNFSYEDYVSWYRTMEYHDQEEKGFWAPDILLSDI